MGQTNTFVPPARSAMPAASAAAAVTAWGAPAFADGIDSAAKKLAATSYPFLKDIDWNSPIYGSLPGFSNIDMLKAVDAALVMGSEMDGKLLQEAAMAHQKAVGSISGKGVTSQAESSVLDTFNAYK